MIAAPEKRLAGDAATRARTGVHRQTPSHHRTKFRPAQPTASKGLTMKRVMCAAIFFTLLVSAVSAQTQEMPRRTCQECKITKEYDRSQPECAHLRPDRHIYQTRKVGARQEDRLGGKGRNAVRRDRVSTEQRSPARDSRSLKRSGRGIELMTAKGVSSEAASEEDEQVVDCYLQVRAVPSSQLYDVCLRRQPAD